MTKRMATTTKQHQNGSDNSASLVQSCILTLFIQLKNTHRCMSTSTQREGNTRIHTHIRVWCLFTWGDTYEMELTITITTTKPSADRILKGSKRKITHAHFREQNKEIARLIESVLIDSIWLVRSICCWFCCCFVFLFYSLYIYLHTSLQNVGPTSSKFISSPRSRWAIAVGGFDVYETHLNRNSSVFACACYFFDVVVFQQLWIGLPQHNSRTNAHNNSEQSLRVWFFLSHVHFLFHYNYTICFYSLTHRLVWNTKTNFKLFWGKICSIVGKKDAL